MANRELVARPPLAHQIEAHCAALAGCRRCMHDSAIAPVISRARAPRGMLVGQAPGKTEAGSGQPFSGRAGRTLFRWFDRARLDEATVRQSLYFAAITRCYPGPHKSGRGDRVPSPRERVQCAGWLDDELRMIQPELLIPVGRLAIDRFLGASTLAEVIGHEHSVAHVGGRSIAIPLPHPSGASSWINDSHHQLLLGRALDLIGARLRSALAHERSVA